MPEDSSNGLHEQAQSVMGQTQDRVREQVDQRSIQLGDQLHQQASDLRAVSDSLREQGKEGPARTAERIAGYAERAGSYLRDQHPDAMLGDVERFGRERPGAFAAGALALGFVASRVLKASSSRRYYTGGSSSAGMRQRTLPQPRPMSDPLVGVGASTAGTPPAYPPSTEPAFPSSVPTGSTGV